MRIHDIALGWLAFSIFLVSLILSAGANGWFALHIKSHASVFWARLFFYAGFLPLIFSILSESDICHKVIRLLVWRDYKREELIFRWQRLCFTLLYTATSVIGFIIWFKLTSNRQFIQMTAYLEPRYVRRLLWCLSSSLMGFAMIALNTIKLPKVKSSPFPSYILWYPFFLFLNSMLVFGFLNAFNSMNRAVTFYPLSLWLCTNFGFFIDSIRADKIILGILQKLAPKDPE